MDSSLNSYTINSKNPHKCGLLREALTARDVLHNPREAVIVRIGMSHKASFRSQ